MSVPPLTGLRRPVRTVIRPRCAWRTVLSFPVNCSVLFLSFPIVVRLVALCLASRMHCSKRKGASPRRKEVTSRRTQGVENLGCATCLSSVLSNLLRTILTKRNDFGCRIVQKYRKESGSPCEYFYHGLYKIHL